LYIRLVSNTTGCCHWKNCSTGLS